jgi:solute carrier family 25 (adenine nucleotide translocator) protein 4/5/6/31
MSDKPSAAPSASAAHAPVAAPAPAATPAGTAAQPPSNTTAKPADVVAAVKATAPKPAGDKPKDAGKGGDKKKGTNFIEDFLMGGIAAAISKTIAAPIERVKLLLQNQGDQKAITTPYKGIVDVFVRVPREQGLVSFWRGNLANVIRYFPTQALNFMFKDMYKHYLERPRSEGFWPCLLGNMASGGAAGATSLMVVYPLDFARTRLGMDVAKAGGQREFNGTIDCILKTAKTAGWGKGGVYNGFVVSCVGIVFYRGAYFGLYDTVSDVDWMKGAGFLKKFALGYTVTVTAGLLSYPLDTIRRRMMMTSGKHAGKYKNSIDCARQILAKEGIMSMYKGAGSNILRGLAGALVLVGFDYIKNYYLEWKYPELRGKKKEIKIQFG